MGRCPQDSNRKAPEDGSHNIGAGRPSHPPHSETPLLQGFRQRAREDLNPNLLIRSQTIYPIQLRVVACEPD